MFDSELKCPNCNHPITTKTKKCPNCKRSISKKLIKKYQNSISKFWGVFLGSYIFFLMFPFLLYEYIGYKWTG
ncbi:MAG: hypothetical protein PHD60_08340, partial [Clostridia bacterium]|nr:hypothetical protein [Clostridia bacterium]